ncbi:uncharacterized protein LOC121864673 isoform X2 [Homarus americanus]|nr:uncharacterized protein LOC121864673 isoform X2 [Homarus americanus]
MSSGRRELTLDDGLTCSVCLDTYSEGDRRPLMLPACGHTFCKHCLAGIMAREGVKGNFLCPTCRRPQPVHAVQDMPVNYSLLEVARRDALSPTSSADKTEQQQEMKNPTEYCSAHGSRLAFWCTTCEVAACGECLFEAHPRPDHTLVRIADQLGRLQEMVKIRSSRVVTQLVTAAEENVDVLKVTFVNLVESLRQRRAIDGLLRRARVVRTSAKDANDLSSINTVNESIQTIQREFEKAHISTPTKVSVANPMWRSSSTSGNKTPTSPEKQHPAEANTQELTDSHNISSPDTASHTTEIIQTPPPIVPSRNTETKPTAPPKPKLLAKPVLPSLNTGKPPSPFSPTTPPTPSTLSTASSPDDDPAHGPSPHTSADPDTPQKVSSVATHSPETGVVPDPLTPEPGAVPQWCSKVCGALSGNCTTSRITLEPRGLHVYSLRPMKEKCDVFLSLSVVSALAPLDAPMVFMDLNDGSRPLGRVYITLQIQLPRAQQFFSLCLGDRGPSYLGSFFHSVLRRGDSGEGLAGGDYESKAGKGGAAIMRGIGRNKEVAKRCEKGMVVRASSRVETAAQFCISVKDGPRTKTVFPFGRVCQGLSVVEEACRRPAFSVSITDCGWVLPV